MSFLSRATLLLAGCSLAAHGAVAQKKNFTMAEATNGLATTLALESINQGHWFYNQFSYVAKNGKEQYYIRYRPAGGRLAPDTIITLSRLNSLLKGEPLKTLSFLYGEKGEPFIQQGNNIFNLVPVEKSDDYELYKEFRLPDDAEDIILHAVNKRERGWYAAYRVGNNLWLSKSIYSDAKDGFVKENIQITKDADKNIISGKSVHREEFGIDKGIFFSPNGNYLAYYRMDQTMVKDYPISDWSTVPATANIIKYPMAGGTSHQVTVNILHPETGRIVPLQTGNPKDQYLTCVSWSPDEKYVFIAVLNRAQDHVQLNQYDITTGQKVKTILEEKSDKYVEPQHELSFIPGSKDQFIWWSQRDGYMHLYLYNTNGKLIRQLTKGEWIVNELIGFSKDRQEVIFTASKESPLNKNTYAVNWRTGDIRRVDDEAGIHTVMLSDDGDYLFDVFTSSKTPKKSVLRSVDGDIIKTLADARNTLEAYDRPDVRPVRLKADDGTRLYGKLILPTHFDSTKKYPVIVYLYNGPHVQLVRNSFPQSGNLWYELLAQKGYIVFTMDGRGSSNRGLAFEQATFGQLGTVEMNDQLKGVEYLQSLPYVDKNRMGVHGWSFGGFMTTSLMLRHPGIFKCAVAGGPVMDWSMYEVMYTERYMNTPQENPDGYAQANLLTKVKQLQGKLLLIHGTDDDVVVWQHSINFIKKCVDEGVQLDYFVYPGHPHNVRGRDRVHLMQKITDYFDLYLK